VPIFPREPGEPAGTRAHLGAREAGRIVRRFRTSGPSARRLTPCRRRRRRCVSGGGRVGRGFHGRRAGAGPLRHGAAGRAPGGVPAREDLVQAPARWQAGGEYTVGRGERSRSQPCWRGLGARRKAPDRPRRGPARSIRRRGEVPCRTPRRGRT
jgi:hypothetical protein